MIVEQLQELLSDLDPKARILRLNDEFGNGVEIGRIANARRINHPLDPAISTYEPTLEDATFKDPVVILTWG